MSRLIHSVPMAAGHILLQDQSPIQSFVAVRMMTIQMNHRVPQWLITPGMNHWAYVLMRPMKTGFPVKLQLETIIGKPRARITSMIMRLRVGVTAHIQSIPLNLPEQPVAVVGKGESVLLISITLNLPVQPVVKPGQVQSTSIPGKVPSINGMSMVTVQTHNISLNLTVQPIVEPGMVVIFSPMVPVYSVTR